MSFEGSGPTRILVRDGDGVMMNLTFCVNHGLIDSVYHNGLKGKESGVAYDSLHMNTHYELQEPPCYQDLDVDIPVPKRQRPCQQDH